MFPIAAIVPYTRGRGGGGSWLQILVLANPLVYVSQGLRAALTDVDHLPLYVL